MKISVSAGHYPGEDSGAVGQTGLQEAEVNKNIALSVVNILKSVGYNALFIQRNELFDIVQTSNDFGADLFISIHCNAAENREARGTETFYGSTPQLAQCIQTQIIDNLMTVDRGIKDGAGLYVIRNTNAPAVLAECEFISNSEGESMLASVEGQEGLSKAIARGITDYVATL